MQKLEQSGSQEELDFERRGDKTNTSSFHLPKIKNNRGILSNKKFSKIAQMDSFMERNNNETSFEQGVTNPPTQTAVNDNQNRLPALPPLRELAEATGEPKKAPADKIMDLSGLDDLDIL